MREENKVYLLMPSKICGLRLAMSLGVEVEMQDRSQVSFSL